MVIFNSKLLNYQRVYNASCHMSAMFEWMIPPDLPIAKQLGSVGSVLHMGTCSKNGIPQIICFRSQESFRGCWFHLTFLRTSTQLPASEFPRVNGLVLSHVYAPWPCSFAVRNFDPCKIVQPLPSCGTTRSLKFKGKPKKKHLPIGQ
jgi:hypothetical protein